MRVLSTLLAATAVCTAMMAAAIFIAGAPAPRPYTGLTAASILDTDGPSRDGLDHSDVRLDRDALGRLAAEASRSNTGADHVIVPAGGGRG